MYIRRKVFSLLDVDGEERYFSTTDFELTDDYGYEDRYYSDDEKKGLSKAAKAAIASGAGLATLAGGVYAGKKLGPKLVSAAKKARTKAIFKALDDLDDEIAGKEVKSAITRKARLMKAIGEGMQKPAEYIEGGYRSLKGKLSRVGKKSAKEAKKAADKK